MRQSKVMRAAFLVLGVAILVLGFVCCGLCAYGVSVLLSAGDAATAGLAAVALVYTVILLFVAVAEAVNMATGGKLNDALYDYEQSRRRY